MHSREQMVGHTTSFIYFLIHSFISTPESSGIVKGGDAEMIETQSVHKVTHVLQRKEVMVAQPYSGWLPIREFPSVKCWFQVAHQPQFMRELLLPWS